MTVSPDMDRISQPVPVEIKNWAPAVKPPYVKNSTIKTYIIDPTADPSLRRPQICDYEPNRLRVAVYVIDAPIVITTDYPTATPDSSADATHAPGTGGYFPVATIPYEFFGPDAMWLNALTAASRVTVIKEYS